VKPEAKLLAASILGAGALIGAGLYLGLRSSGGTGADRPLPTTTDLDLAKVTVAPMPTVAPVTASPIEPPTVRPLIPTTQSSTDDIVRRALAQQHSNLRARCWKPKSANDTVTLRVRFLFVDGKQQAASAEESAEHPELAECLRRNLAPLEIPDKGPAIASMIALTFP
jgi:hypothetical protein